MKAYCVFCKTGSEKSVVDSIHALDAQLKAIAPVRVLQEKRKGNWELQEQSLIPGYVFIYTEEEVPFEALKSRIGVYKILEYQTGVRELMDSDYEYASWIYRHDGRIQPSRALMEGSSVRVVDGPLMDGLGTIIRIDRHKRRAWVEFDFDGSKRTVSLSVIDITSCED